VKDGHDNALEGLLLSLKLLIRGSLVGIQQGCALVDGDSTQERLLVILKGLILDLLALNR